MFMTDDVIADATQRQEQNTKPLHHQPMEPLYKRLKRFRERAGYKNAKAAADAIGCARSTVANWELEANPNNAVGHHYLLALAKAYNVNPEAINDGNVDDGYPYFSQSNVPMVREKIAGYGIRAVDDGEEIDTTREVLIPVYEVYADAGEGAPLPEWVETAFELPFQRWWIEKKGAKPENIKIVSIIGESMVPTLYPQDRAVIDTGNTRIQNRGVYLIMIGWDVRIKRLLLNRDGSVTISSDNENKGQYPDEVFTQTDFAEQVRILGKAIDKSGSGGL